MVNALSPLLSAKRHDRKATTIDDGCPAWIHRVFEVISASFFVIYKQTVDKVLETVFYLPEHLQAICNMSRLPAGLIKHPHSGERESWPALLQGGKEC